MNKTVTITINGIIFHIEEEAYFEIKDYLDSISAHYADSLDTDEMIADIESSIAEKFSAKISAKKEVVTMQDVEEVIRVMGRVEEIDEEVSIGEESKKKSNETKTNTESISGRKIKKLYRNPDDVIIAGVCSGIAEYFAIDTVIIRVIFVALIFAGGTGIWMYLLLWLVMPIATTRAQKLEMQGDPVTLKKLEEALKKNINKESREEIKQTVKTAGSGLRKILALPFRFLAEVFRAMTNFLHKAVPILSLIAGFLIMLASFFTALSLSFVAGVLIFKIDSPYIGIDFSLKELLGTASFYSWTSSAYLMALIPVIMFLLLGISLVRRKSVLSVLAGSLLFTFWMIAIVVFGVFSIDAIPLVSEKVVLNEEESKISKNIELKDFSKIKISNNSRLAVEKSDNYNILLRGREESLEKYIFKTEEGVLDISKKREENYFCIFCHNTPADITISMPDLEKIYADSNSRVQVIGFAGENFDAELNGADLIIDGDYKNFNAKMASYSELKLGGRINNLEITMEDYSRFSSDKLYLDSANIEAINSSRLDFDNILMNASSTPLQLKVSLSNTAKLYLDSLALGNSIFKMEDNAFINISGRNIESRDSVFNFVLENYSEVKATDFIISELSLEQSGDSRFVIEGQAKKMQLRQKDSSKLEGYDFVADIISADLSSSAKALVESEGEISVKADDFAMLYYQGDAKINKELSGNAKVLEGEK